MRGKTTERLGDMHSTRGIQVHKQTDGDVILSITEEGMVVENFRTESRAVVEFCVSGGRSPRTLQALHNLFEAIELDNRERPIQRA
jgi:hypothetical protein